MKYVHAVYKDKNYYACRLGMTVRGQAHYGRLTHCLRMRCKIERKFIRRRNGNGRSATRGTEMYCSMCSTDEERQDRIICTPLQRACSVLTRLQRCLI